MRLISIGGCVPFTTIDYPGALSAVLFCQGCSWRCRYCHNPHLQPVCQGKMLWGKIAAFLQERRGFLDAVVFSGGEPLLQPHLGQAIQEAKQMGFRIGLHTAGIHPASLSRLLHTIDWVGLDIKAPFDQYEKITQVSHSGGKAKKSAEAILASGVNYEFRTTMHPALLAPADLDRLTKEIAQMGARHYVLQRFRPQGSCGEGLARSSCSSAFNDSFFAEIGQRFETFSVR